MNHGRSFAGIGWPAKWQAANCPGLCSISGGTSLAQIGNCAIGQRVWKTQPLGGWSGVGMSPVSRMRRSSSATDRDRDRREQRLRIWMERVFVERAAIGELHDLAEVHHRDARRDVLDDREIVRDEEIRQPEIAPADPAAG